MMHPKKLCSFGSLLTLWKNLPPLLPGTGQAVIETHQNLYLFYAFVDGEAK